MKSKTFKTIRIIILLFILATVWTTTANQKKQLQNWQGTVDAVIIPIAADQQDSTREYINQLSERDFNQIENFFNQQVKRYRPQLTHTLTIRLAHDAAKSLPPLPPKSNASTLSAIVWSLKMRWWAARNKPVDYHKQQIRLYVLYHKPKANRLLPHSTGLEKGLIGLIHTRAQRRFAERNNLVIAHELLHIFGATDKYDLASGLAIFPGGYAEPNKQPIYPQRYVEIMGRSIPVGPNKHKLGFSLKHARINHKTAQEIGLLRVEN